MKILFIDDDHIICDYISLLLEENGYITTTADSGETGVKIIKTENFDCVILDLHLPGISGIETLKQLKKINPITPVIMFTGAGDIPSTVETMTLGAYSYIEKPFDEDNFLNIVKNAISSIDKVDKEVLDKKKDIPPLSPREKEVLIWMEKGKNIWEISQILEISENTVKFHSKGIFKKLNTKNRAQSIAISIRLRLTD